MLMGSFAKAAEYFHNQGYLSYSQSIATFFSQSLLTPKGHPYGVNRMFLFDGSLVTCEDLNEKRL
ncbi:MAG: hypothetical protein R3A11_00440 [Bdellovibrionota bacterium]